MHLSSAMRLTLAFMGLLLISEPKAETVTVVDAKGQKVSDAVIELNRLTQSAPKAVDARDSVFIMDQLNKQFVPELLIIPQGAKVNFPNSDNIRHHVYSFSKAKPFELELYSGQPKAPLTFEQAGVVVLGCNIHDSMVGYIYVAASHNVQRTNSEGQAELDLSALTPDSKLTIWHPLAQKGVQHLEHYSIATLKQQGFQITLSLTEPKPRNTFQELFGNEQ